MSIASTRLYASDEIAEPVEGVDAVDLVHGQCGNHHLHHEVLAGPAITIRWTSPWTTDVPPVSLDTLRFDSLDLLT